jgi:hypothetical protein
MAFGSGLSAFGKTAESWVLRARSLALLVKMQGFGMTPDRDGFFGSGLSAFGKDLDPRSVSNLGVVARHLR